MEKQYYTMNVCMYNFLNIDLNHLKKNTKRIKIPLTNENLLHNEWVDFLGMQLLQGGELCCNDWWKTNQCCQTHCQQFARNEFQNDDTCILHCGYNLTSQKIWCPFPGGTSEYLGEPGLSHRLHPQNRTDRACWPPKTRSVLIHSD